MFWKIVGGIGAFLMVVVLGAMVMAAAGVAVVGSAVSSLAENIDVSSVEVTDANGRTEIIDVNRFLSESGRVEVVGDNGERVTIDVNVPRVTVQDAGEEGSRVVIGGGSGIEGISEVPQIRIDGRRLDSFDGFSVGRMVGGFFRGMINLALLTVIVIGVWMAVRNNRRPVIQEKSVDAAA